MYDICRKLAYVLAIQGMFELAKGNIIHNTLTQC